MCMQPSCHSAEALLERPDPVCTGRPAHCTSPPALPGRHPAYLPHLSTQPHESRSPLPCQPLNPSHQILVPTSGRSFTAPSLFAGFMPSLSCCTLPVPLCLPRLIWFGLLPYCLCQALANTGKARQRSRAQGQVADGDALTGCRCHQMRTGVGQQQVVSGRPEPPQSQCQSIGWLRSVAAACIKARPVGQQRVGSLPSRKMGLHLPAGACSCWRTYSSWLVKAATQHRLPLARLLLLASVGWAAPAAPRLLLLCLAGLGHEVNAHQREQLAAQADAVGAPLHTWACGGSV